MSLSSAFNSDTHLSKAEGDEKWRLLSRSPSRGAGCSQNRAFCFPAGLRFHILSQWNPHKRRVGDGAGAGQPRCPPPWGLNHTKSLSPCHQVIVPLPRVLLLPGDTLLLLSSRLPHFRGVPWPSAWGRRVPGTRGMHFCIGKGHGHAFLNPPDRSHRV